MSVLILNASYEPLTFVSWQRAIALVVGGRGELLEQDGDRVIRSSGGLELPWPAVVRLLSMVRTKRAARVPLTRQYLLARDGRVCQVSGCDRRGDTIDHLIPRSRGGRHDWLNVAVMCSRHNSQKGDQTLDELGWALKRAPKEPTRIMILTKRAKARQEWERWVLPASA